MRRALSCAAAIVGCGAIAVVALWMARTPAPDREAAAEQPEFGAGEQRAARERERERERGTRGGGPSGFVAERGSAAVVERIERIRELGARRDTSALPWLERSVLAEQPEIAPALIATVAELAAAAPQADRDRAARTLGEWLQTEAAREGADARGNTAVLVEALAKTDSAAAVDALVLALDAQRLPLHLEVAAVAGLYALADPRASAAVERFGRRVETLPRTSGFDEALRQEAVLTARATLASLGS